MESGAENHPASGKSGNGGALSWNIWELGGPWGGGAGTPHHDSSHHAVPYALFNPTQPTTLNTMSPSPAPFFSYHHHLHAGAHGGGDAYHLTCLKLGKRQYYEESHASDVPAPVGAGVMKRERVASSSSSSAAALGVPSPAAAASASSSSSGVVARCQVEGCNVALADAKDYHRRHKVCEMHSKAPKVVVLGMEQRFCQQCSRFHVVTEFDESKRSCRRRLAGHNERRRKSSAESIIGASRSASHLDNTALAGFPYITASNTPSRALSLLSPKASSAWVSPDLSSQSSAALRELIAENRAAVLARQLFSDRGWHSTPNTTGAQAALSFMPHQHPLPIDAAAPSQLADGWEHLRGPSPHVTLDLMQMPGASFEFLSAARSRSSSKDDDEECCEIWKSLEGTHVV